MGQPCAQVGLECLPSTATCEGALASKCICSDEFPGEFVWDCSKVKYCKCACPCGSDAGTKVAYNTCEALGCVNDPTQPCPAAAEAICKVICMPDDAGPPDAGVDAGVDARPPDAQLDGPPADSGPLDGPAADAPAPDGPAADASPLDAPVIDAQLIDAPAG